MTSKTCRLGRVNISKSLKAFLQNSCKKDDSTVPFPKQAEETIAVNYTALVDVCNALYPLLRPHARVVNLSSSAGHLLRIPSEDLRKKFCDPKLTEAKLTAMMREFVKAAKRGDNAKDWGNSAYTASKVGVSALTVVQQRIFDSDTRKDIIVNSVHPGYVNTDLNDHKGPLTVEEGAYAPLQLALLPADVKSPRGEYVWKNGKVVSWVEPLKEAH